jgi:1-acyl-sn-glycerol-3-phosphate acyltransferase
MKPAVLDLLATLMSYFLLGLIRVLTGSQARWWGCPPKAEQRIYFANHQSHADLVMIWAALPKELRRNTRAVAARDYWTKTPFKQWLTSAVFNVIYVSRERHAEEDPLEPLIDAMNEGDSIILFPEGTRGMPTSRRPSKPACTTWRCKFPRGGTGARLDQQRAARHAQGRGGAGAGVVLGHLWHPHESAAR